MSQYYSVQTNNRFAFLQEDGEAILGQKPESVIAAEAEKAKIDQASKPARNNRNNNKDNNRTGGNRDNNRDGAKRNNQPRNNSRGAAPAADYEATEDTRGADRQDADVKTENRNRTKFGGKAERGRKQFDRRSGPDARREKGEDTDPTHEQRDRDAADVDAEIDGMPGSPKNNSEDGGERRSFNRGPREPREAEDVPVGVHIDDYLREQEAARFKIEEDEAVEEYNDLQKEIIEGGFKPLAKSEAVVHQSLTKKSKKADKDDKAVRELTEIGRMPNLHNESRDFRNNRNFKDNRDNKPAKKDENEEIKNKKKAYKDNDIFPGLE